MLSQSYPSSFGNPKVGFYWTIAQGLVGNYLSVIGLFGHRFCRIIFELPTMIPSAKFDNPLVGISGPLELPIEDPEIHHPNHSALHHNAHDRITTFVR